MTEQLTADEKIWAHSGDSHFMEPPDLFEANMPAALAERMPRSVKDDDGLNETVYVDGQVIRRKIPSLFRKKGANGKTMVEASTARTAGAHDVVVRMQDLDQEGIWGELVYGSLSMWQWLIRDPVLAREGVKVTNDWALEEIQGHSPRLVPTAGLSVLSIPDAVDELQRVAGLGFHAVALPDTPPPDQDDYNQPSWDPLWAAAEEAGMVICFHIGTGNDKFGVVPGPGALIINFVETSYPGQRAVTKMAASGALERHPDLKVVVSEAGASWVPFVGDRMNEAHRQHSAFVHPPLTESPKEALYRQVYTSFQHDESAIGAMTAMGYRNVMWGSDYPHVEGTFGHTQETLHHLFDDVPDDVRERITKGTFLELFPHVGEPPTQTTTTKAAAVG